MQVYRGMDIGTAKPSLESRQSIPHHLIDVADVSEHFSVAEFQRQGRAVLEKAGAAGDRIVVAGGSGLHFRALVDPMTFPPTDVAIRRELEEATFEELQEILIGVDHAAPDVLDFQNPRRVIRAIEVWRITGLTPSERANTPESDALREYRPTVPHVSLGFDPGDHSGERIEARFARMLDDGLVAEVEALAPRFGRTAAQAVGYRELLGFIRGTSTLKEATEAAVRATRGLVKRQRTFFRRDPRIQWMAWQDGEDARIEAVVNRIGEAAGWTL